MILPQFSLRMALGFMAVLGFVSLLISRGLAGSAWAMGISVALAALVFSFLTYAVVFGLVYGVSKTFNRRLVPRQSAAQEAVDAVLMDAPRGQADFVATTGDSNGP